MLATAVALNLENAPISLQETAAEASPLVNAVMGGRERPRHVVEGMLQRHILSTGLAAIPPTRTGYRSICRISTRAEILRPTCSATSPQRVRAASWPRVSTMQRR